MSKLKLSSNVLASLFAVVALTAAGCGGSDNPSGTGGKGGSAGAANTGGRGGAGTGGRGTGGIVGTGGVATGGAAGASTGGVVGTGGVGTGGAAGAAGAGGTGGACGNEIAVCTVDAVRCTAGVPQKCIADATGCAQWVNQTVCGAHQTCNNATGACVCNAEPRCGTPGAEGNFCPTVGGATFSVCTRDANSCLFVSAEGQACTAPQTCQGTGVVPAGTACGCPANGTTLNSGCANVAINATVASPSDNAVLRCEMVGACKLWRILVNCADQSLTAGTDAVSNAPACVCKAAGSAPGAANAIYVDPDPPMAISMTNGPTGALQPAACRLRSITAALGALGTTFTRVVAIHESSSTAHFPAETQPLAVPAGVTVTTADGPSFNTAHYTIDLGGNGGPRVTLANGSNLSGFTLLGAATGPTGANAQGGAAAGVDLLGCTAGASTADHLAIVGTGTQVGVGVRGNCALTGSLLNVTGAGTGVNVTYSATTGAASFAGSSITASVTGTGIVIGNATSSATITSTATVASSLTVTGAAGTGVSVNGGSLTMTSSAATGINVSGGGGTGVALTGGTATLTTTPITVATGIGVSNAGGQVTLAQSPVSVTGAIGAAARGIVQTATAPATASLSVTGGSITLPTSSAPTFAVDVVNGTATLAGVTTTVGGNVSGIRAQNNAAVTVNGASVVTTSCKVASADCDVAVNGVTGSTAGQGIVVPTAAGNSGVVVTVGGTTQISGFQDGISSGDGSLTVAGTVQVTGNVHDGISLTGANFTTTTQVSITGATISGNGNEGVFVSSAVPTSIMTTTISGNKSNGVNVAQSQSTGTTGAKFLLSGSTVATNGTGGATPAGRGVFLSATDGKVSAILQGNHISTNVLEGVRVQGGAIPAGQLTEVAFNSNHINGNLTAVATAPAGIIAGGAFFAAGRIRLGQFVGNRVFANGSNQIGFAVAQDTSLANPVAWDLSSGASGVDAAMTCSETAQPNYVYCYGASNSMQGTLGVAVSDPAIAVKVKGMHWAVAMPTATGDFSNGILAPTVLTPEPTEGVFQSCAPAGAAGFCADIP